ncbi:MAG: hypothetical protein ACREP7_17890 [Lysobacter sp.]
MHHGTDKKPATAAHHAGHGTGTNRKASMLAQDESRHLGNLHRSIAYFDAAEARHRAEAVENRAMAEVHRGNPLAPSAERILMAQSSEDLAVIADRRAIACAKLAADFRARLPNPEPIAIEVTLTIGHNTITKTARIPGRALPVSRTWTRISASATRCNSGDGSIALADRARIASSLLRNRSSTTWRASYSFP